MKKTLLLLLFLSSMFLSANAQFKLTINGFVLEEDASKNYIVCSYDNLGKDILFTNVMTYLTKKYISAKDVISKVDNEIITLKSFHPQKINAKMLNYDLLFTMSISFRDDKIKIDAPGFECTSSFDGRPFRLTMSGSNKGFGSEVTNGLFKKDGKPSLDKTIFQLEDFFNSFANEICRAASGIDNKSDW